MARCDSRTSEVVAWVDGEPVLAARVEGRLGELRGGPHAGLLPQGGKESRQLRRWVGQLVVAESLCRTIARRAGLAPSPDPVPLDEVAAMELGSLAAAVLAGSPYARAVYRSLVEDVPEAEVEDYYDRNRDLFRTAEALATGGDAVRPYPEVRDGIAARLRDAAARRRFRAWLDERARAWVELCPGWEHPGDPAQPDNTHRH